MEPAPMTTNPNLLATDEQNISCGAIAFSSSICCALLIGVAVYFSLNRQESVCKTLSTTAAQDAFRKYKVGAAACVCCVCFCLLLVLLTTGKGKSKTVATITAFSPVFPANRLYIQNLGGGVCTYGIDSLWWRAIPGIGTIIDLYLMFGTNKLNPAGGWA